MKAVVTYEGGEIVVHDEYGLMDERELRRISRVPAMEAEIERLAAEVLALRKRVEAADAVVAAITSAQLASTTAAITCHDGDFEREGELWGDVKTALWDYRATGDA